MFDIASTELLLVAIVAVVVIGPKDLPRALYKVGQVIGKARAMSRHFRSGVDAMMREVEVEEMEKKWATENKRIMAQYPNVDSDPEASPASDASSESDTKTIASAEGGEIETTAEMEALPEVSTPAPQPEASDKLASGKPEAPIVQQPGLPFGDEPTGGKSA